MKNLFLTAFFALLLLISQLAYADVLDVALAECSIFCRDNNLPSKCITQTCASRECLATFMMCWDLSLDGNKPSKNMPVARFEYCGPCGERPGSALKTPVSGSAPQQACDEKEYRIYGDGECKRVTALSREEAKLVEDAVKDFGVGDSCVLTVKNGKRSIKCFRAGVAYQDSDSDKNNEITGGQYKLERSLGFYLDENRKMRFTVDGREFYDSPEKAVKNAPGWWARFKHWVFKRWYKPRVPDLDSICRQYWLVLRPRPKPGQTVSRENKVFDMFTWVEVCQRENPQSLSGIGDEGLIATVYEETLRAAKNEFATAKAKRQLYDAFNT